MTVGKQQGLDTAMNGANLSHRDSADYKCLTRILFEFARDPINTGKM